MDPKERRELVDRVTKKLAGEGRLIEGGWQAFSILSLEGASEVQQREMRKAWFLGAQHLFASILTVLDAGDEATEQDMRAMDAIDQELRAFVDECRRAIV